MGIRQLPSGAFQVRFQHRHVSYVATYPTREVAEDAEPLMRAAAIAGRPEPAAGEEQRPCSPSPSTTRPSVLPTPDEVRISSVAAAVSIGALLADIVPERRAAGSRTTGWARTGASAAATSWRTGTTLGSRQAYRRGLPGGRSASDLAACRIGSTSIRSGW